MTENRENLFNKDALQQFYGEISSEDGIAIEDFQKKLGDLFNRARQDDDVKEYRIGRGEWKKLRDEVLPVSCYFFYRKISTGKVRFLLSNEPPDCMYWGEGDKKNEKSVEVTIAQGRERFFLGKRLNEEKMAGGFLGLGDEKNNDDFEKAIASDRVMYSTEQALDAIKSGVLRCLERKKNHNPMDVLLIAANLIVLPFERWEKIIPELARASEGMPFMEVHVIADGDLKGMGFTIKSPHS